MEDVTEKFVRINALNVLYGRVPYVFYPYKNDAGRFVTGQESILTEKQMFGEEPITSKQKDELCMGEDPYIINPDNPVHLFNARKFDLSYKTVKGKRIYLNPKDYAEFTFFSLQPEVVRIRKGFQKNKHFFYIEDKDVEAAAKITHEDLIFEAKAFVKSDTSIKRLKDIALLLTHIAKGVALNPDTLTITQLQARLYDLCNSQPEAVLQCKSSGGDDLNDEKLFILKALKVGEIVTHQGSFYYGKGKTDYIGDTFDKVIGWIRDPKNSAMVARLGSIVKKYDDKNVE